MSTPIATGTAHDEAPATLPMNPCCEGPTRWAGSASFGGRFVPETLMDALNQLAEAYEQAKADPEFQDAAGRLSEALRRPSLAACSTPSG